MALGFLTGAILATVLWFATPSGVTARTLVHIASLQPVILGETPESRVIFADYQRTQQAYVKSRKVLNKALDLPNVKGLSEVQKELDPVTWLEKQIRVDFAISPEIMRISMSGTESKQLAILVDAVRDAYLAEIVEKEHQRRLAHLDLLKELYAQNEDGLKKKREALRTLANGLGSTNLQVLVLKQEFALKELHTIQTELLQVQSELRKARLELASQGDPAEAVIDLSILGASTVGLAGTPLGNGAFLAATRTVGRTDVVEPSIPPNLIDEYLKKDVDYDRHARQVARLELERDYYLTSTKDPENERAYKRIIADLKLAKQALAACRDEIRPRLIGQAREKLFGEMFGAKQHARVRLENMKKLEAVLTKEVEDRSKINQNTSKESNHLIWLQNDIAAEEGTGTRVSGQIQNLQVEIRAEKRIRSMDDTVVLDDTNTRWKTSGMGFGAGFALSLLGVSYLEFRARKVNKPEELTEGLQLKLLGTMPVVSNGTTVGRRIQSLEANHRFQKHVVESVDATRLVLLHAARNESMQVLLTTSAFGGEGKTMLSSHLAVNLATAGHRTLLIDADLRRPAVHKVFHLPNEPGLCDVLRGGDLATAVRPGPVEGLSLLLAGECKEQPGQLLTRGCIEKLLPMLRQQYEYIIIDSAPLLPVVDSQYIAQHVDGVIMSVIRNVSRLPAVHAACEKLVMLDVRILGVVVHGATNDSYYHDYASAASQIPKTYSSQTSTV